MLHDTKSPMANIGDVLAPLPMLSQTLTHVLTQAGEVLEILYDRPDGHTYFTGLRVGSHFRHIYDHFFAVFDGVTSGVIDYDIRSRNSHAEMDIELSQEVLGTLLKQCHGMSEEVLKLPVQVMSEVSCLDMVRLEFSSNVEREILYLVNHTVHHLAYVSLLLKSENIALPTHIGLAPSTATFQRQEAK